MNDLLNRLRHASPYTIQGVMATLVIAYVLEDIFYVGRPFSWPLYAALCLAVYGAATLLDRIIPPSSPPPWRRDDD